MNKTQTALVRKLIREEIKREELDEGVMDWLQGGLDIAGLVPGIGEAADGINAAISLARGNPIEALLSLVSMIPVAGDSVGKGGKLVLKILDPVLDLIKAGGKAADIVKKIGPERIKKISGAISLLRDTLVKYRSEIQKGFEAVKEADLESIEKIIGIKVPKIARSRVEKEIKKAASKIDTDGIAKVVNFITELGEEKENSEKENSEKETSESYLPVLSIRKHILGESYMKSEMKELSQFFLKFERI